MNGSRFQTHKYVLLLLLLLLLKEVGSTRLREGDIHPISPRTPAPQYQPKDRKKRTAQIEIVEDNSRDTAPLANKKALVLLFKSASLTPSNTGSARSFQMDTKMAIKILRYCEVILA